MCKDNIIYFYRNNELLNVVNPDVKTGGESLGEMLLINSTIQELDVSWNFLRLESASTLADSLNFNSTLHTLKLAYNAFGDLPTQYLGKALKTNKTITYLDISYNSINPKATTVLANGLIYNQSLLTLVMDGNIPGHVGAQALVAAVQRASGEQRILNISFENCDCIKEDRSVFDPANPGGSYHLDLSEPYGQMVSEELMYLANYRAGCVLNKVEYDPKGDYIYLKNIKLVRPTNKASMNEKMLMLKNFVKCITETNKVFNSGATLILQASELLGKVLACFDLFAYIEVRKTMIGMMRSNLESKFATQSRQEVVTEFSESSLSEIFLSLFQIADAGIPSILNIFTHNNNYYLRQE